MRSSSPYLILAAFVVLLPAQSASAREHFSSHRAYRHHHTTMASFHSHRYGHHRVYATTEAASFGTPFAAPFSSGFAQPAWRGGSGYAPFGRSYGRRPTASGYESMAAAQAAANGVPVSLVERVIARESGGNARAVSRGNFGLMQIRLGTARAMGYTGSAAGLLDPATNMTYAVRYLAGAYRAAGGNESRAVALYARGYYAQAKARGFSPYASGGRTGAPVLTEATWNGGTGWNNWTNWNNWNGWYAPFGATPAVYRAGYHGRHHHYRRQAV